MGRGKDRSVGLTPDEPYGVGCFDRSCLVGGTSDRLREDLSLRSAFS